MSREEDNSEVTVERRERFHDRAPEYLNMLFATVFSITHDYELSTEIAQQAVVNYLIRMEKKKWQLEIENEGAYLVRIAHNLLNDGWRAHGRAEWMSLDQQLDDRLLKELGQITDAFDVENKIYWESVAQILPWKTILGGLDARERRLFLLHEVEGLSNKEVARELNDNVIIVRYELQKIKAKIRARVKKICGKTNSFKSDT